MGQTLCTSACVNTQTDTNNCGMCGRMCSAGQVCTAGACGNPLPTRYTQAASTQAYIDACAAGGRVVLVPSLDDSVAPSTIPFAFRFWDQNIAAGSAITVSTNGNFQFVAGGSTSLSGSIPSSSVPNNMVAPYWGDNYTSASGVCVATIGTTPNRKFVVEWRNAYHCCTSGNANLTFEAVLSETSNVIDFVYTTMTNARASTVGLEDSTGTNAIGGCAGAATSCAPAANSSTRFVPAP